MSPTLDSAEARGLLERVRALLPGDEVREVRMFGAVAVMVGGSMVVAVHQDGSLLVRVDPAEEARLLGDPHASRAEMGAGRSMGRGWIRVEAVGLTDAGDLRSWLDHAARYLARGAR